jgi:N-acetylglucosaminyl-diphospho-decaprenol L-rhamnosyltransferase
MTTQAAEPELSVIIVSYNTRDMTLKALETLYEQVQDIAMQVIVWDNASKDGSCEAIADAFPQVELHRCPDNLGFASANNRAAEFAIGEWLLLLNSDTETRPHSIQNLLDFAKANPTAGIVGGRTVFGDGSLNATSCFNRMTVWSLLCYSTGVANVLSGNRLFDPERIQGAMMDEVRRVDIVTGCFFLLKTELWRQLGGFDLRYFMYAEEWDLCLRAGKLGYKPMITPDATIVHHGGASAISSATKQLQSYRGKATIIRDHFGAVRKPLGLGLLWFTAFSRHIGHSVLGVLGRRREEQSAMWKAVWEQRGDWLKGY